MPAVDHRGCRGKPPGHGWGRGRKGDEPLQHHLGPPEDSGASERTQLGCIPLIRRQHMGQVRQLPLQFGKTRPQFRRPLVILFVIPKGFHQDSDPHGGEFPDPLQRRLIQRGMDQPQPHVIEPLPLQRLSRVVDPGGGCRAALFRNGWNGHTLHAVRHEPFLNGETGGIGPWSCGRPGLKVEQNEKRPGSLRGSVTSSQHRLSSLSAVESCEFDPACRPQTAHRVRAA